MLNLFDSEPGGDHASEPSSKPNENALHSTPREEPVVPPGESILDAFDPEPRDVPLEPPAGRNESVASAGSETARNRQAHRCFILWPPVRYDYAYISTGSRSGRDALVAPWHQTLPGTEEEVRSSWVDGHYLGTDDRGRDVLARLVYGFRVSLLFGFALALSGTVAGAILGAIQGFFGGWVDLLGQRFTEIWGSLPRLYLLMILSSLVARNIYVLFIILNLTSWMGMAAYMRAEFLKGRNLDYVRAARALGVPNTPIMFRHILPNSMTPIITFSPFAVTGGILALVSLDFLALGVPSPFPSLGELLAQGQANLRATWIILPTFVVLSGTITLLTFIGDGLRNAFDPRKTVRK
ncbi:MAG: ABC transporter permease subunit [Candidatus Pacebacteria bacterium]|nr:ABC transporter permease subunit [Candidatus Paceibacterota bacterium]